MLIYTFLRDYSDELLLMESFSILKLSKTKHVLVLRLSTSGMPILSNVPLIWPFLGTTLHLSLHNDRDALLIHIKVVTFQLQLLL